MEFCSGISYIGEGDTRLSDTKYLILNFLLFHKEVGEAGKDMGHQGLEVGSP